MGDVILGIDFKPKKPTESEKLLAISQAMAPDEVFVDTYANQPLGDLGAMNSAGLFGWSAPNNTSIAITCTPEMSIQERVRRSIYHGAGLPYPKDSA